MREFLKIGKIKVFFIWFDSMGAKSSSVFIETPDVKILIDPGAAVMQPSYPLSKKEKEKLKKKALEEIKFFAEKAEVIVITHYHYDHHTLPKKNLDFYSGKTLFIKNPNKWINRSQFFRARKFIKRVARICGLKFRKILVAPEKLEFYDPVEEIKFKKIDKKGTEKGKEWLKMLFQLWNKEASIEEWEKSNTKVLFAEGKNLRFKNTIIKFSPPLFHGIEYDKLGWVFMVNIIHKSKSILYTSDLQGPIIKDYADKIIDINPDLLVLDGPATYLLGYLLTQKNLERAIKNIKEIIKKIKAEIIIYDHHLTRDIKFKERISEVYRIAEKYHKKVLTAPQVFGKPNLIEKLKIG